MRLPARLIRMPSVTVLLIALGGLLLGQLARADDTQWLPKDGAAREYAERALRTQRYVAGSLASPAGGRSCADAPFMGYSREAGSELSDAWYDASQIMADAAMIRLGQSSQSCMVAKTVFFLDLLVRPEPERGYYPRANVDGTTVTTRDTFADDNALIGLAFLDARAASRDEVWRASLLERARNAATFLTEGGMWDETFGGGFWWNTARGAIGEGKPSQTTAIAVLLFARLYEETGDRRYAEWAQRGLKWLNEWLFDPVIGLYRYGIRHWDVEASTGKYLDTRLFGYDQGIMIEVYLAFERSIEPRAGHLERARFLAERSHDVFWEPARGSYRLESTQAETYTPYAAWLSQSLIALYDADPDPTWLRRARENLDAIEAHLLDPSDGGYYHMQFRCGGRTEPGCDGGVHWAVDRTKLLFSQSWMQRAQAQLAEQLRRQPEAAADRE
jgi:uncharacterized protein YyaL (SSP411 family)